MNINCWSLFKLFSQMALLGFGGVLPFAYRYLVERSGWLTDSEFGEALSIAQLLPGPTICNLAVMVGQRFAGIAGALAALSGLLAAPFFIVIALGVAYQQLAASDLFARALHGMAAAAAGLVLATAAKLAKGMLQEGSGQEGPGREGPGQESPEREGPGREGHRLAPRGGAAPAAPRRIAQGALLVLAFVGLGVLKLGLITVVFALAPLGFLMFAFVWRLP